MKISIITVVFNASETIGASLASLREQNYPQVEHIIIDGASTDGTLDILNKSMSKSAILVSESDRGIYDALNKGLKISSGEIIGFLHADDVFANSSVLSDIAFAFSDPSVEGVYGDLVYVDKYNIEKVIRRWRSSSFSYNLLGAGWMPPHPTLFVRREWYVRIGGFNDKYRIAADYLSILKLFSIPEFKTVYLNKVLVQMRLGGTSNHSFSAIFKKSYEDWMVLRSVGFCRFSALKALILKNFTKIFQFL
ncbi:glycosyltransferase family 2 protein [Polynucleobacter sp. AP-Nino-20-G2]|uniref:glycosyltransferase family 2 protein n=1 Tax=Polynucleobacter sp. AP-Nino-20-G2 TaxID=2576917 RepID=UPI001BFD0D59|nr:glycosyltransferase family 2 protein [Polynucleobacter sp. AP-Nino-20-G2]QWE16964.1 glycosyltransferase [Polynucleobacter sp. AP-Nino-20-G2]